MDSSPSLGWRIIAPGDHSISWDHYCWTWQSLLQSIKFCRGKSLASQGHLIEWGADSWWKEKRNPCLQPYEILLTLCLKDFMVFCDVILLFLKLLYSLFCIKVTKFSDCLVKNYPFLLCALPCLMELEFLSNILI